MKLTNNVFVQAFKNEQVAKSTASLLKKVNGSIRKANILMIHSGRCGSTVLGGLLNQHPQIKWSGEIFTLYRRKYSGIDWGLTHPKLLRDLRIYWYRTPYYGFEIKYQNFLVFSRKGNISYEFFFDQMVDQSIDYVIILERKNYLNKLVSMKTGKSLGRWNTKKSIAELPKVEIDTLNAYNGVPIVDYFDQLRDFYRFVKEETEKRGKKSLYLTYEEHIFHNPAVAYEEICNFLGVSKPEVEVKHRKINTLSIEQRINNYEEVNDLLSGTEYSWMLNT